MANPTPYEQAYDFSDFASHNPATPLPGDRLDIELAELERTTDEIIAGLADVRRSDGALKNGVVTRDSLSAALLSLIGNWRDAWVTATAYIVDDTVSYDGSSYICRTAHTSGVFATDLAAVKWALVAAAGDTGPPGDVSLDGAQTLTNKTLTTPIITLEQGASVAPTAEGRIAWDTDDNKLKVGDGSGTKTFSDDSLLQPINADLTAIADTGIVTLAGTLWGLALSNNGTDATNDIDIAAGIAIDSTNAVLMRLASSLTKRLDAAWAVGSGNGGLDTGSIANTTYHVHLIKRPDTGVADVLFSTSASAPTLPTNYTVFRRIGSILRVSSAIKAFTQIGDYFEWTTPGADIASAAQTTNSTTRTLASIPTGKEVLADIGMNIYRASGTGQFGIASSPARAGTVVDRDTAGVGYSTGASNAGSATARMLVLTNTSAQIVTDANQTGEVSITVFGFFDNRGRT